MTSLRAAAAAVALCWAGAGAAAAAEPIPQSRAWVKVSTAELAARYDTLWAASDLHGRLAEVEQLLVASRLAVRQGSTLAWNRDGRRALIVIAGDLIDGGPDSVGVVLLLERLQREAAAAGSRIVVLLGNHEAKLLAHPGSATPELLDSAAVHRRELGLSRWRADHPLDAKAFDDFLRELPVVAFVGTWLFAHAGYVDGADGEPALRAWLARLDATVSRRDRGSFEALLDPRSILEFHNWWRHDRDLASMRRRLQALGLNAVVFGHDPDAFGATGTMAMNREGWLIKLDAGLKLRTSRGMLLRCEVRDIVRSDTLAMSRDGRPTCRLATPDGSTRPLPVR